MPSGTRRRLSVASAHQLQVIRAASMTAAAAGPAAPAKPTPPAAGRPRSSSAARHPPARRQPTPCPADMAAAAFELRASRARSPARPARRGRMAFVPVRGGSFVRRGSGSFLRHGAAGSFSAAPAKAAPGSSSDDDVIVLRSGAAVAAALAAAAVAEAAAGAGKRSAFAVEAIIPAQNAELSKACAGACSSGKSKTKGKEGRGMKLLSAIGAAFAACVVPVGAVGSSTHDALWMTMPAPMLPAGLFYYH